MRETASILHADADAFFASVEQRLDPKLRGRPIAVGVGVVMAASYEARAFGVRGGMGGSEARRRCPGLIRVEPHFDAYVKASRELFEVFRETAPSVEGLSLEEAFLDVSGLERISGTPERIGARLREEVRREVGLPITVGVARTKLVAKMASRAAKPDGLLLIAPGDEREFLEPIAVEEIWGIGPATAGRLHAMGIRRVGELARRDEAGLIAEFGASAGGRLHAIAALRDPEPVRGDRARRSFGSQSAMRRGHHPPEELESLLIRIAERVTRRMREAGRAGRTVSLRLRFDDFETSGRSTTLPRATASTDGILEAARRLLADATPEIEARGITLLGIAVTNLDDRAAGVQLELAPASGAAVALDAALDALHERFGRGAVLRGPRSEEDRLL